MLGYFKSGDQIDYTNTSTAITAGSAVRIGKIVGIAVNDIAATTGIGPVQVKGVVKVTKAASQAWTQGQAVYWDGTEFTSTGGGNYYAGVAALAAASGAALTTGYVLLNVLGPAADEYTSPEITTGIEDENGCTMIGFTTASTAVDYINLTNAAANGIPVIAAAGSDTDIDLQANQKGSAYVQIGTTGCTAVRLGANQPICNAAGTELIKFVTATTAVDEITITQTAANGIPSIGVTGDDTDIDFLLYQKGAAKIQLGAATCTGVQLMADQAILDSAGCELIKFSTTATAVNEVTIQNQSTGVRPKIMSSGESNIGLDIAADGSGIVRILGKVALGTSNAATLSFFGTTGATQAANISECNLGSATQATTTEIRAISTAVDAILAAIKTYRLIATA